MLPPADRFAHAGYLPLLRALLFNVIGRPFRPRNDRILLPVLPAAVPFVETEKANVVARGPQVKTRIFSVKSANQVSLRAHYEVDAMELGVLLLQLGRLLGGEPAGRRAVIEASDTGRLAPLPSVSNGRDGWLTVSLTRLLFPPFCCDCGMRTEETQEFQGYAALLRLGSWLNIEGGEHVRVGEALNRERPGAFMRLYSDYPFPWRKETGGAKDTFEAEALRYVREHPDQPFYRFEDYQGRSSLRLV